MVRTQTMVQLTDELIDHLDAAARQRGVSRSAVIRSAIEDHLAEQAERSVAARIVEGYRRVPPETPDGWGDLPGLGDAAAGELGQRLDAEERSAGLDPW